MNNIFFYIAASTAISDNFIVNDDRTLCNGRLSGQNNYKSIHNYSKAYHNCTKTKQLTLLFPDPPKFPPPEPLQIISIPKEKRVRPDWKCKLIHSESGLSIPGHFTFEEASKIKEITRSWHWEVDSDRSPRCASQLLLLLEKIVGEDEDKLQPCKRQGGKLS